MSIAIPVSGDWNTPVFDGATRLLISAAAPKKSSTSTLQHER